MLIGLLKEALDFRSWSSYSLDFITIGLLFIMQATLQMKKTSEMEICISSIYRENLVEELVG